MKNHVMYFTKAERLGIGALVFLCLILWVVPSWLPDKQEPMTTDFTDLPASFPGQQSESEAEAQNWRSNSEHDLQPFDPNAVNAEELLAMGLPERSVRSWQNYLAKGGRFKNWEDLLQFRALSDTDRHRIKPYVNFKVRAKEERGRSVVKTKQALAPLEEFDPNRQDKESLLQMGLSERVASNWDRFLQAGGHFRSAEEINKVYGLSEADFNRLLPYVQIAHPTQEWAQQEAAPEVSLPSSYEKASANLVIDINEATAEEWQQLRGIGPAYSRRIVNFRDKLGGFHQLDQVKETYGLPDSVYQSVYLQLRLSPIRQKLAINQLDIKELAAHPYLSYNDARAIVRYREEHGPFQEAADLEKLYSLEKNTLEKMAPYWGFSAAGGG